MRCYYEANRSDPFGQRIYKSHVIYTLSYGRFLLSIGEIYDYDTFMNIITKYPNAIINILCNNKSEISHISCHMLSINSYYEIYLYSNQFCSNFTMERVG